MQRQQHKAEADGYTAKVSDNRARTTLKGHDPDDEEDWREPCNIKADQLHDQSGADIGPEHDGERRNKTYQPVADERRSHEASGCTALQQGGNAKSGEKGGKPRLERGAQEAAEVRSKRPKNSGLHHVQAPEQKGDTANEVEKDNVSHQVTLNRGKLRSLEIHEKNGSSSVPWMSALGH